MTNKNISLKKYIEDVYFPLDVDNGQHKKTSMSFEVSMSNYILEYFKDLELQNISSTDIELFLNYFRNKREQKNGIGMSPKTTKHVYSELDRILKSAKRRRYIPENPMDYVCPPKVPKKEVIALSKKEMEILVEALKDAPLKLKCIFYLLLTTGIRRGELTGLHWNDIDFENQQVYIRNNVTRATGFGVVTGTPKTFGSNRKIPLSDSTLDVLKIYKNQIQSEYPNMDLQGTYIFHNKNNLYKPNDPSSFTRLVKKFMLSIGLPSYSPHQVRHSFATHTLANGADIKSVVNILGHADASTTLNYYTHASMDQMRVAANKFTSVFGI